MMVFCGQISVLMYNYVNSGHCRSCDATGADLSGLGINNAYLLMSGSLKAQLPAYRICQPPCEQVQIWFCFPPLRALRRDAVHASFTLSQAPRTCLQSELELAVDIPRARAVLGFQFEATANQFNCADIPKKRPSHRLP